MAGKVIKVDPSDVMQNAQAVAAATAQAAKPGPVPTAGGISPIDQAAAGVATAVSTKVAESSAKLAPKSAEILHSSITALSAMGAQEAQNAQQLSAVAQGAHEQPTSVGNRTQAVGFGTGGPHPQAPPGDGPPAPDGPHLIYCYPSARPDFWWCEGYEEGKGPYSFGSPFDMSGVA